MKTESRYSRKIKLIVCGMAALCLTIRILYLIIYTVQPRDTYKYYLYVSGTRDYILHLPPLSFLFLKNIYERGLFFVYGIGINIFLGVVIAIEIMIISSILFRNTLFVFVSGLFCCTNKQLIHYSCQITRENMMLASIGFATIFFVVYMKKNRLRDLVMMSIILAISTMFRYEAIECLFVYWGIVLFSKRFSLKQSGHVITSAFFFAIVLYFINCYAKTNINYYFDYATNMINKSVLDMFMP